MLPRQHHRGERQSGSEPLHKRASSESRGRSRLPLHAVVADTPATGGGDLVTPTPEGKGPRKGSAPEAIGRRSATLQLRVLVETLRSQQVRPASPPMAWPTELRWVGLSLLGEQGGAEGLDPSAELAPFYELAQRCRRSGMPDMVLAVLNTYRAAASPQAQAQAAQARDQSDLWALVVGAHAQLGTVKLAARVLEDCVQSGRLGVSAADRGASWRASRILEAFVTAGAPGLILGLHLKQQVGSPR
jgi:hypothetical protein